MDDSSERSRVTVCGSCRQGAGVALAARLTERLTGRLVAQSVAVGGADVRVVPCLRSCGRPLALAVEGPGKGAYLFAGLEPEGLEEDLLAFLRLFGAAPDGEVVDARPCGALRFHLLARLPP